MALSAILPSLLREDTAIWVKILAGTFGLLSVLATLFYIVLIYPSVWYLFPASCFSHDSAKTNPTTRATDRPAMAPPLPP